jgi:hypothetical protein
MAAAWAIDEPMTMMVAVAAVRKILSMFILSSVRKDFRSVYGNSLLTARIAVEQVTALASVYRGKIRGSI